MSLENLVVCGHKDEDMAISPSPTLMDEITDFLLMNPSLEQIIAYKPSEVLDNRLHELLDKNASVGLTPDERSELDRFLEINHLLIILKAKARLKLANMAWHMSRLPYAVKS